MTTFFKLIGLVFICAVVALAVVFFAIWSLALIGVVLTIFSIAYFSNIPIVVKRDGKKIGTYTRKGGFKPI